MPVDHRWRFRKGALLAAAWRLAPPPIPLVWGSGFERASALLEELAAGRELLGNSAGVVRATKDPEAFAATAAALGIRHPERRLAAPADRRGWLCKRAGAAGGGHVHMAGARPPRGRGWYWQRRTRGEPISGLILGNGRDARLLGISGQLTSPRPGRPYRFGGVLVPAAVSAAARDELERVAMRLAEHYRLRGLASMDALVAGDTVTLLELNPRPGGSLDAYGAALGINLLELHVHACRGDPLPTTPDAVRCAGSLIAFADRANRVPAGFVWPEWAADRSPPGSSIAGGGPVCTVLAEGHEAEQVLGLLGQRVAAIGAALRASAPLRYDGPAMTHPQSAQR